MIEAGVRILVVHARKAWLDGLQPQGKPEIPPLDYGRVSGSKREFPELTIVINGGIGPRWKPCASTWLTSTG